MRIAHGEEAGIWRCWEIDFDRPLGGGGGNGTCIFIAEGTDVQDPELVSGLQPKTVDVDCLRLSKPRIVPDGWTKDVIQNLAVGWQIIQTPKEKTSLRMDIGQTQYSSSFLSELKSAAADDGDDSRIAYWGEVTTTTRQDALTKTVVVSTTGAQYDR